MILAPWMVCTILKLGGDNNYQLREEHWRIKQQGMAIVAIEIAKDSVHE
jgi:hypothetical protein